MTSFQDLTVLRLLHEHGDSWEELKEGERSTPVEQDPERLLLKGAKVFRCASCNESFTMVPGDILERLKGR